MGKTSCSFGKNSRAKKSLGVSFLVAPSLLIIVTRLQSFTEVGKEPGTSKNNTVLTFLDIQTKLLSQPKHFPENFSPSAQTCIIHFIMSPVVHKNLVTGTSCENCTDF